MGGGEWFLHILLAKKQNMAAHGKRYFLRWRFRGAHSCLDLRERGENNDPQSQGRAKFPTGGDSAGTPESPRADAHYAPTQIRCDSEADGKVRMKENNAGRKPFSVLGELCPKFYCS